MTQEKLGEAAGLTPRSIYEYESSDAPRMRGSTYARLARALGMTTTELDRAWRGGTTESAHAVPGRGIPIVNKTQAGAVHDYQDVGRDHYTYCPIMADEVGDPGAFAFVVVGDSMAPEWQEGDTCICAPLARIETGDPCFVQMDGSAAGGEGNTFKRMVPLPENRVELRSDNPRYSPIIIPREQIIRAVKVVGKYTRYSWRKA